jgi:hypothetical protein
VVASWHHREMPLRSLLAALLGVLSLGVLAGCADSRTAAPDLAAVQPSGGVKTISYLRGRLTLKAPADWPRATGPAPLVATLGSGPALIAIWRYPRPASETLPTDVASLEQAQRALIGAAGARDPTFRVISSSVVLLGGIPGVELDALETVRGRVRRVRSTHLYASGAELVVDEFAPEELFHTVDRTVFSPLLHSVRVVG